MSISDQAFIRAYHEEATIVGGGPSAAIDVGLGSVIPPPHAKFSQSSPQSTAKMKQASSIAPTIADSQDLKSSDQKTVSTSSRSGSQSGPRKLQSPAEQSTKAPLSSFAGMTDLTTPGALPRPALEVDAVRWPTMCETLLQLHGDRFDRMAVEICREAGLGQKITAITGLRRGEGRTTLALCLARRLAAGRASVALVDADFFNPSLAAHLHIAIDRGWEAVLRSEETLWEVMIESVSDRLTIVPLSSSAAEETTPAAFRIAATLNELAEHYDVVLVDAGPILTESYDSQWLLEPDLNVHNVILAHDVRHTQPHRLAAGCVQLAEAKRRQLGIAEMFVVEK